MGPRSVENQRGAVGRSDHRTTHTAVRIGERATDGFIKVLTDRRGRILGAGIVGQHAGELIQMWSLAISQRMSIKAMTGWISPYPTFAEINKRAAYRYYAGAATSPMVRRVIGWLKAFG